MIRIKRLSVIYGSILSLYNNKNRKIYKQRFIKVLLCQKKKLQ